MYLLTYIVVFVMCEGGDWATTRRMICLHKGVWVPGVRYLIYRPEICQSTQNVERAVISADYTLQH